MDLITVAQTGSNAVEYARQVSRTNNAAVVAEYDTDGGDFNLKPKSTLAFELLTASVKTIPTYVVASRNILADAPQLRSLINEELTYMVRKTLEDQIVAGDGSSGSFTGILNTSGIQTRTQQSTGDRGGLATDTKADALRRAITDVELEFYEVTGIMLHPANAEALELEKDDNKNYVNIYDPVAGRLWRVPVVESSAMPSGKGLVGNFRLGATLWDRQATDIRVGEPGDMFLQNAVAVLAELRAAFAVKRPAAFERVTFA
jgi:HK97 family phage major capsid protein